jgi:hypothetical protein
MMNRLAKISFTASHQFLSGNRYGFDKVVRLGQLALARFFHQLLHQNVITPQIGICIGFWSTARRHFGNQRINYPKKINSKTTVYTAQ